MHMLPCYGCYCYNVFLNVNLLVDVKLMTKRNGKKKKGKRTNAPKDSIPEEPQQIIEAPKENRFSELKPNLSTEEKDLKEDVFLKDEMQPEEQNSEGEDFFDQEENLKEYEIQPSEPLSSTDSKSTEELTLKARKRFDISFRDLKRVNTEIDDTISEVLFKQGEVFSPISSIIDSTEEGEEIPFMSRTESRFSIDKAILDAKIIESNIIQTTESKYTTYTIQVSLEYKNNKVKWTVDRRFNEFKSLHEFIQKELELNKLGTLSQLNFPKFPKKSIGSFINKYKEDFIIERIDLLNKYLKHAMKETPNSLLNFLDCFGTTVSYLFWDTDITIRKEVKLIREKKNKIIESMDKIRRKLNELDEKEDEISYNDDEIKELNEKEYQNNFNLLEEKKKELISLYLMGDEFFIDLNSVYYKMIISETGKIILFPWGINSRVWLKSRKEKENEEILSKLKGKRYYFYIDEIQKIIPLKNTFRSDAMESMLMILNNGNQIKFQSRNRLEIIEIIGSFIGKNNRNRINLVNDLKKIYHSKLTNYDSKNEQHESLLFDLWSIINPNEKLESRISKQWVSIGFQGNDPSTDFRGMGLLGLQNNIYFAKHFNDECVGILEQERDYPFCVAGINVTSFLLSLLQLSKASRVSASSEEWNTPLFHLLNLEYFYYKEPFQKVYCVAVLLLDKIFVERKGTYGDFPFIFDEMKKNFVSKLARRPANVKSLANMVGINCSKF
eukprot:gene4169-7479_t